MSVLSQLTSLSLEDVCERSLFSLDAREHVWRSSCFLGGWFSAGSARDGSVRACSASATVYTAAQRPRWAAAAAGHMPCLRSLRLSGPWGRLPPWSPNKALLTDSFHSRLWRIGAAAPALQVRLGLGLGLAPGRHSPTLLWSRACVPIRGHLQLSPAPPALSCGTQELHLGWLLFGGADIWDEAQLAEMLAEADQQALMLAAWSPRLTKLCVLVKLSVPGRQVQCALHAPHQPSALVGWPGGRWRRTLVGVAADAEGVTVRGQLVYVRA